jgi:hypothetical protein
VAEWQCFSCGQTVAYEEPLDAANLVTEVDGRTTFSSGTSILHRCEDGAYRRPSPTLRQLQ